MLDVVVSIEGGEPHDAAEAALHAPHPVNCIWIYSANRRIKDDSAEHLESGNVLSRKPSPVRSRHDVIFENERLKPAIFIERRDFLIVQRPPKDVGSCVNMRIHQTGNRAHRRWWGREDSNLRKCLSGA